MQAEIVIVRWSFASDHRNLQLGSDSATQDAKSGGFETSAPRFDRRARSEIAGRCAVRPQVVRDQPLRCVGILYLGQPVALLIFENFDVLDRARLALRDEAVVQFGEETGPVMMSDYGAFRFTRVGGPTPEAPDGTS